MVIISAPKIREHLETDLGDAALSRLIEDAEAEINERYGPIGLRTLMVRGGNRLIFLPGPAEETDIVITETLDGEDTVLTPIADPTPEDGDFRFWYGGRMIERLDTGAHPGAYWGERVLIDYMPRDDSMRRQRVVVDLVKLALAFSGRQQETIGDLSMMSLTDYTKQRERLIASLDSNRMAFA